MTNKFFAVAAVFAVFAAGLSAASPASADSWTMPNLVGMDLQGAQDAIQSLTDDAVWYSGSTDLTGQDRMQLSDRNWQVCTSSPVSRAALTAGTKVSFGVVRIDTETCP